MAVCVTNLFVKAYARWARATDMSTKSDSSACEWTPNPGAKRRVRAYCVVQCGIHNELVRQSIRPLGKGNGQKVNFGKAEREAGLGRWLTEAIRSVAECEGFIREQLNDLIFTSSSA